MDVVLNFYFVAMLFYLTVRSTKAKNFSCIEVNVLSWHLSMITATDYHRSQLMGQARH